MNSTIEQIKTALELWGWKVSVRSYKNKAVVHARSNYCAFSYDVRWRTNKGNPYSREMYDEQEEKLLNLICINGRADENDKKWRDSNTGVIAMCFYPAPPKSFRVQK